MQNINLQRVRYEDVSSAKQSGETAERRSLVSIQCKISIYNEYEDVSLAKQSEETVERRGLVGIQCKISIYNEYEDV